MVVVVVVVAVVGVGVEKQRRNPAEREREAADGDTKQSELELANERACMPATHRVRMGGAADARAAGRDAHAQVGLVAVARRPGGGA